MAPRVGRRLRGHKADPHLLANGTAHISTRPLAVISILLGTIYGVCMGLYLMVTRTPPSGMQMITCAIKVLALFFLTLVVTLPTIGGNSPSRCLGSPSSTTTPR